MVPDISPAATTRNPQKRAGDGRKTGKETSIGAGVFSATAFEPQLPEF